MSSTSLPTPPRKSADKENWGSTSPPGLTTRKSIEWAPHKEVFTYAPVSARAVNASSTPRGPRKSILKPARPLLPFEQEKKRDITPLPDDALENAQFLEYPVSVIIAENSTLRELTEGYSILAARIRSSVPQNFFVSSASSTYDTRHALFDPLRREAEVLSRAIVRDLGRVFTDPFLPRNSPPVTPSKNEKSSLPTPQDSPATKKGGMTEDQVKYARDLSTVTTATLKLLTLAFQVPAIYNVFTRRQLDSILTAALSIPLAESIRSPTARKICGFAISLLQSQRLPDSVLNAGAYRIGFALKRAIEGELGREGKKGATAEALRAVHDLSLYRPAIFVPIFHVYLTTLLEALLTPTCALRVLAAHALGGFVLSITRSGNDFKDLLLDASRTACDFFLRKAPDTGSQSTILRALRTALRTTEPTHHAQGPFWSISVLASMVVLLGPSLMKDRQLLIAFRGTIDIGLKAKKRIVRAITSTLWGPLIWVWQTWRWSMDDQSEGVDEQDDNVSESEKVRACFSTMIRMTTHLPIGVSFIGALLGSCHTSCRREDLLLALYELNASARQGGESTQRALELLDRFVNSREDVDFYERWTESFLGKLVPRQLLSVSPGLLTLDTTALALKPTIENIIAAQPTYTDVRPLSNEEKCVTGVWTRLKDAWISCIEQLEMSENDVIPDVLVDVWSGLVRAGMLSIDDDRTSLIEYASRCADVLISVFTNKAIDLREQPSEYGSENASSSATLTNEGTEILDNDVGCAANQRLKLMLVRTLWTVSVENLPEFCLIGAVKPMISFLVKSHRILVPSTDSASGDEDEALSEWSQFCAQVAAAIPIGITKLMWENDWEWDDAARARAWRSYARGWAEDSRGSWREAATILGLPFREKSPWDMCNADVSEWSSLLTYAVDMAIKDHVEASDALELVVSRIESQHTISMSSTLRVADHLVGMLAKHIESSTELPDKLIGLVHEILVTTYPPEPPNKILAIWLLRSLQTTISNCPTSLVVELLEDLHDGLCTWMADDCGLFSTEEYSSEIIPLFQTTLVALESLPPSTQILQSFSALFASSLQTDSETGGLLEDRAEALSSFTEFWNNNCLALETPNDGWSEGMSQVLRLVFSPIAEAEAGEIHSHKGSGFNQSPLIEMNSGEEDELDILPRTTTPRRRPANHLPLPLSPSPVRIRHGARSSPVKTPTKSRKGAKRPQLYGSPRIPALFNTLSCATPSTRRKPGAHQERLRIASASSCGSLASENTDKENVHPLSNIDLSYRRTKRVLPDEDSGPLRSKRNRTESYGSDDSVDARAVEQVLQLQDGPSPGQVPFGMADINTANSPQATTRRARVATDGSTVTVNKPVLISTELRNPRRRKRVPAADVGDDDEYLPSSSDVESEDEGETSGSSSPIGPFTPRVARRTEYSLAITQDPTSDDVITSSSPTRKIRRLARAERLPTPKTVLHMKANDLTVSSSTLLASSMRK